MSHGFAQRRLSHSEPARCLKRCSFGEACVGSLRCKDELGVFGGPTGPGWVEGVPCANGPKAVLSADYEKFGQIMGHPNVVQASGISATIVRT